MSNDSEGIRKVARGLPHKPRVPAGFPVGATLVPFPIGRDVRPVAVRWVARNHLGPWIGVVVAGVPATSYESRVRGDARRERAILRAVAHGGEIRTMVGRSGRMCVVGAGVSTGLGNLWRPNVTLALPGLRLDMLDRSRERRDVPGLALLGVSAEVCLQPRGIRNRLVMDRSALSDRGHRHELYPLRFRSIPERGLPG